MKFIKSAPFFGWLRWSVATLAASAGSCALAAPLVLGHAVHLLLIDVAAGARPLAVRSPGFAVGGVLPIDATAYGANRFPGLSWSAGPTGTVSYALVIEGDGGHPGDAVSIHLTAYNLPSNQLSLPAGLAALPGGANYGPNVHGKAAAYTGPHPHDASPHAYHFQIVALDTRLPAQPGETIGALESAMRGHVLAAGELIGTAVMPAGTSPAEARAPIQIESGLLAGVSSRDPSVIVFKGIPYAAPPVGPLRWRAPMPALAWQGVRHAAQFGAACPQFGAPGLHMDEDCLTANVWTKGGAHHPVLVWIYGGGFTQGSGSDLQFDGTALAQKGVVVVTFNYRLGVLGFLATPALSAESGHHASGNYGILDDIAMLRWVHRNIAAFGGDPAQVTIAGQSAGAGSVGFLAMSPLAHGLFERAIAQSHVRDPGDPELRYLSTSYRTKANAEAAGTRYVAAHGATTLAALRQLPWQSLLSGSDAVDQNVDTTTTAHPPLFRPVVDGWVIPRDYSQTLAARSQNHVMFVAGNNRDESGAVPITAFARLRAGMGMARPGMPQSVVTLASFQQWATTKFGAMAPEFLRLYPADDDQAAALQHNAAVRDNSRVSTYLWARQWQIGSEQPVYTYFWTHAPPGPGHDQRGAYHGSEISYVFGNVGDAAPWTAQDRVIADRMSSDRANIVKSGNPNGSGLPHWPQYNAESGSVMELGDHWGLMAVASPAKIDFWQRYFASQTAW